MQEGIRRLPELDCARCIGMILIVLLHTGLLSDYAASFFSSFFMPLFFLLSGMLIVFRNEPALSLRALVQKKARRILLPYVLFQIPPLINSARLYLNKDPLFVFEKNLCDFLTLKGMSVFWFLPALFFAEITVCALLKKTSAATTLFVTLLAALPVLLALPFVRALGVAADERMILSASFQVLPYLSFSLAHMLLRAVICTCITALGALLVTVYQKTPAWAGILLLAAGVFFSVSNGPADLNTLSFGRSIVLYTASSLTGGAGIILSCRLVSAHSGRPLFRLLSWYGKNSLIIMVTHMDYYLVYLALTLSTPLQDALLRAPVMTLIVFAAEIPVIYLCQPLLKKLTTPTSSS